MDNLKNIKVLTIDDEPYVRRSIAEYLGGIGYTVLQSENGREGIEIFYKEKPDIVIADLRMPEKDGLEVLETITRESSEIPVILVSGSSVIGDVIEALRLGAWDYIIKPIKDLAILDFSLKKALERKKMIRESRLYHEQLEGEINIRTLEISERRKELELTNQLLKNEISERLYVEDRLKKSLNNLERIIDGTINTISKIVEMRDPYTGGHQKHVAQLSRAIAEEMGLAEELVQGIYIAAQLHDTGKIAVPTEILVKPGKLNNLESMFIKYHAKAGWELLSTIEFAWPIGQIVLQHHERINGTGYPFGLRSEYILKEAKIIGITDVVESMMFHRPYREALGLDSALEEITQNKGILYDPEIVDVCISLFKRKGFKFTS